MKGSEDFRKKSQSYLQFQNEIFMYDKILPFFQKYVKKKKMNFPPESWIPITFLSTYIVNEFDESKVETILVQENLHKKLFSIQNDLYLTENHFELMIEQLAQLHSVSIALKIENFTVFEELIKDLKPLCFEDPSREPCLYDILHDISTTRLFENTLNNPNYCNDVEFIKDIQQLKKVVGKKPVKLLDRFRELDDFSVIVHGDYHRNNIMFKLNSSGSAYDIRMIDFQVR